MDSIDELKSQNEYLQRVVQSQEIINKLLQTSLSESSLDKMLEIAIEQIVSTPLLKFKSKGAIFLVENDPNALVLKAQRGLSEPLLKLCAKVPFGKCLCGKAAQTKDIIFSQCVDDKHDISYEGMPPHGHYCVPILLDTELLGVITLYVEEGHEFKSKEYVFLKSVGNVIAGMIRKKNSEIELKQTQLQLLQSGKMVAVGNLAAGVANEINNPMGFIGSNLSTFEEYTETILQVIKLTDSLIYSIESEKSHESKEIVSKIKEIEEDSNISFLSKDIQELIIESKIGVDRVQNVVSDLKQLTNNKNYNSELINIEDTLDIVLNIIDDEIKFKADIVKNFSNVSTFKGDPHKIGQTLINILMNAVQSLDAKGTISIKTFEKDNNICVSISDTGRGIDEENIVKVFTPFYTTKPTGKGTGLGLSISYEIIQNLGGNIIAESKVGIGSTFTIKIPKNLKDTK